MKAKKAIKKIVALGMGATMVGATLLGASAADLGNYPDQFVKDGQFDGLLVVGEEADSVDTIGSINVAMGLQAASVSETTVCDDEDNDSSSVSVEDGVEFETSSEKLYKYKTLGDIKPTLDETDLPNLLADGTY
ncbi:MAG: S-layer protein, partial [Candidatus Nanoarchaeia archaeon]